MFSKGVRFVGAVDEVARADARADDAQASKPPAAPTLRQDIHFCTTSDGVRIAYSGVGHGPPLVRAAHWLNHLEYDWQSPIVSPVLRELAAGRRLVRYDGRGNGLSDWDVNDISFEGFVRDLESVVRSGAICAARNVTGQCHLARLCGATSEARHPARHLRRIRTRAAQARCRRSSNTLMPW